MRKYIFAMFIAQAVMANPNQQPLGVKSQGLIKEGKLDKAKKLLEASLSPVAHWRLAHIAIQEKRYNDFHKHLEGSLELKLLKNPEVLSNLYNALPEQEQKWLLSKVEGLFEPMPESTCPYFELTERKKRAQMLMLLLKGKPLKQKLIIRELFVSLPETISIEELKKQLGFHEVYGQASTEDILKRVNLLLTFGQNEEAQKTIDGYLKKPDLPLLDTCELKYSSTKVLRKLRKYEKAKENFASLAAICPEETKIKARFMELTLLRMQSDEKALPQFDAFVKDYPKHTFTDDILLFKAGILFDKNRTEEAHKVLDLLIKEYPDGDMIHKALFLQAMSYLKLSQTKKSLESLKKLESISPEDSLNHASAVYWQARLSVYPEVKFSDNKKISKSAQKKLEELVNAKEPKVYSWLAYSLLSSLGLKTSLRPKAGVKTELVTAAPKSRDLLMVKDLISQGFNEEALYLLDTIAVDEREIENASAVAIFYDSLGKAENGHQKLVRCNGQLAKALAKEIPDVFRRISYPKAYLSPIEQVLDRIDVPKSLVYGIIRQESGFLSESCSWAGAKGLMQLIYPSAKSQSQWWNVRDLAEADLFHAPTNLLLASSLLKNYWQQFGNMAVALCAYNAGPKAAKNWLAKNNNAPIDFFIEEIPFKETNTYVKNVLGSTFAYSETVIPHLSLALEQ